MKWVLLLVSVFISLPAWSVRVQLSRQGYPRPAIICTHQSSDPQVIPLCDLCPGYAVSKRGDSTAIVRCPGDAPDNPFFQVLNCKSPSVVQRTAMSVNIKCGD
jgi:hypothetical protein